MADQSTIDKFAALFAGLTRAKGRYAVAPDPTSGVKAKGKATTVSEPVTVDDYAKHLAGTVGLGIVPVRDDGTCVFGAVDIDQYTGIDHVALAKKAVECGSNAMICRSKSGGVHAYLFAPEPGVPAHLMIEHLKKLRTDLGVDYRKAREIFPKQKQQTGGIGNWINLPYFGDSPRRAIRPDGTEYTLEEFVDSVKRIDLKALKAKPAAKDDMLVPTELPPCLERLVAEGIPPGMRNEAVFNFAVFGTKKCKMDRVKVAAMTSMLNVTACHPPLSQVELNTSIDSVIRHEYNYRCQQSPLVEVCNKELCNTRLYGPSCSSRPGGMPEIEKIEAQGNEADETLFYVKLATSPRMIPCTSRVLMEYDLFKKCALDILHMMLPVVKQKDWDTYITARFATLVSTVRVAPERTKRGLVLEAIDEWIRNSASPDPKYFAIGRPFIEQPNVYISIGELSARLKHVQSNITFQQIARILEENQWEKTSKTIGTKLHENVWTRPIDTTVDLPDEKTATVKEVDGHIVIEAPQDLPTGLVEELAWDDFNPHETGEE